MRISTSCGKKQRQEHQRSCSCCIRSSTSEMKKREEEAAAAFSTHHQLSAYFIPLRELIDWAALNQPIALLRASRSSSGGTGEAKAPPPLSLFSSSGPEQYVKGLSRIYKLLIMRPLPEPVSTMPDDYTAQNFFPIPLSSSSSYRPVSVHIAFLNDFYSF